jgi:dimethylargininase
VVDGLRHGDHPGPDYERVVGEHIAYVAALSSAGVDVEVLPPLEAFPDSMFVEDPALVFGQGAILLRPGAASRAGEAAELAPVLRRCFPQLLLLDEGCADGGDVLVTPHAVYIGLSARTDHRGAAALVRALDRLGLEGRVVSTPPGVLHLKTGVSLLDETTLLASPAVAASGLFPGYRVLVTPEGEQAAANALRVNQVVMAGEAFPRTLEMLAGAGFEVVPLAVAEVGKIDAGLSCMSLRWGAQGAQATEIG